MPSLGSMPGGADSRDYYVSSPSSAVPEHDTTMAATSQIHDIYIETLYQLTSIYGRIGHGDILVYIRDIGSLYDRLRIQYPISAHWVENFRARCSEKITRARSLELETSVRRDAVSQSPLESSVGQSQASEVTYTSTPIDLVSVSNGGRNMVAGNIQTSGIGSVNDYVYLNETRRLKEEALSKNKKPTEENGICEGGELIIPPSIAKNRSYTNGFFRFITTCDECDKDTWFTERDMEVPCRGCGKLLGVNEGVDEYKTAKSSLNRIADDAFLYIAEQQRLIDEDLRYQSGVYMSSSALTATQASIQAQNNNAANTAYNNANYGTWRH